MMDVVERKMKKECPEEYAEHMLDKLELKEIKDEISILKEQLTTAGYFKRRRRIKKIRQLGDEYDQLYHCYGERRAIIMMGMTVVEKNDR